MTGAQKAQAQAQANKNAAISGMFESAIAGADVLAGAQTGAYKQKSYGKAPKGTTKAYDEYGNEIFVNPYNDNGQPSYLGNTSALSNTIQFK